MVKNINKTVKPSIQNHEMRRMNRRVVIPLIVGVIFVTMACIGGSESPWWGSNYSKEDEDASQSVDVIEEDSASSAPEQPVSRPQPANQSGASQSSQAEINNGGTNEYSVSAQDFNCICQVDGNVNVELRVNGDQLEVVDANGGAQVYEKIGENTFKKSWMGYYILMVDGVETKVDEERSTVITLNDNGYTMEHYQGSESSPCCIHDFTQTD